VEGRQQKTSTGSWIQPTLQTWEHAGHPHVHLSQVQCSALASTVPRIVQHDVFSKAAELKSQKKEVASLKSHPISQTLDADDGIVSTAEQRSIRRKKRK
jgi:hypothetical protein